MKRYTSRYFELSTNSNGMINYIPKPEFGMKKEKFCVHFALGCNVANSTTESCTEEWYGVCLAVMDGLVDISEGLKHEVTKRLSYGAYFPKSLESVHKGGISFKEAVSHVNGYAEAVNDFKEIFETTDSMFRRCLNETFPEFENLK